MIADLMISFAIESLSDQLKQNGKNKPGQEV